MQRLFTEWGAVHTGKIMVRIIVVDVGNILRAHYDSSAKFRYKFRAKRNRETAARRPVLVELRVFGRGYQILFGQSDNHFFECCFGVHHSVSIPAGAEVPAVDEKISEKKNLASPASLLRFEYAKENTVHAGVCRGKAG